MMFGMRFVSVSPIAVIVAATLLATGCSRAPLVTNQDVRREVVRHADERSCLTSTAMRESRFITPRSALGGPGSCGALRAFQMSGSTDGRVAFRPAAVLNCPMVSNVDAWFREVVQPAAKEAFGASLDRINVAASYSCRTMNGVPGARISEHSFANALDVSAFVLNDGRTVTVKAGWQGSSAERFFLRRVHRGACQRFYTVLGPEADAHHRDHFHMDLRRHRLDRITTVCR